MTGGWLAAMRRALSVDGGRDGVPMLLALCDERPGREAPTSGADSETSDRLDACRAELAPSARDDDLGIVITVLATVAAAEDERA